MSALARWGAPLACVAPQPAAPLRLAAFAHAGGGPQTFRRWGTLLAPHVELWTATLPGRAGRAREPFAREWRALVAQFADAVEVSLEEPFALFGHSLGATLAFEVTRELCRRGATRPVRLFVSARSAPDAIRGFVLPKDDDELVRALHATYGGVPSELYNAPDVLAHFVAILRADLELAASYRHVPGPALDLPITALAGDEDATVTSTQLERWASHTTGALRRHDLRGGHFYFEGQERRVCEIVLDELLGGRVVCEEVRVAAGCAV